MTNSVSKSPRIVGVSYITNPADSKIHEALEKHDLPQKVSIILGCLSKHVDQSHVCKSPLIAYLPLSTELYSLSITEQLIKTAFPLHNCENENDYELAKNFTQITAEHQKSNTAFILKKDAENLRRVFVTKCSSAESTRLSFLKLQSLIAKGEVTTSAQEITDMNKKQEIEELTKLWMCNYY